MKVLIDGHMIGTQEGGNETYTHNLYRGLQLFSDIDSQIFITRSAKRIIKTRSYFIQKIPSDVVRLGFELPYLAKKHKIDIIHSNYISPFYKNTYQVITVHDLCFKRYPHYFNTRQNIVFNILLPLSLKSADAIIAPSKFVKKELLKYYPQYDRKVKVVSEAADEYFHPIDKRVAFHKLREKYPDIQKPFVLCLNSNIPKKNINDILKAFNHVRSDYPDLQLIIIGGDYHIEKDLLNKNVLILNFVPQEDLLYFYNASSLFIYYSIYEGFGLPILEAMRCKIPVIASDIPVHREVARDGIAFAASNSPLQLASQVRKILADINHQKYIIENGKRVEKMYSWKKTAFRTKQVYESIINNRT